MDGWMEYSSHCLDRRSLRRYSGNGILVREYGRGKQKSLSETQQKLLDKERGREATRLVAPHVSHHRSFFFFPVELFPKLFDIPAHRSQLHGSHFFPFRTFSKFALHDRTKTERLVIPSPREERLLCCPLFVLSLPSSSLRSEEHTSELQSRPHLVCRLLLE